MVALLAELDPLPLAQFLNLGRTDIVIRREFVLTKPAAGKLDMVVTPWDTSEVLAVLEAKVADTVRSGQLEKYERWVSAQEEKSGTTIGRYLVDLNRRRNLKAANWQVLNQADLVGLWRSSRDQHCAWLSGLLVDSLTEVDTEAESLIGESRAWATHDVITRRLADDLDDDLSATAPEDWYVAAGRDDGGSPMLTVRLRHPKLSEVWLLIDLRSPGRRAYGRPWTLRLMMRAFPEDYENLAQAQRHCFSAAMNSLELFGNTALQHFLQHSPNASHQTVLRKTTEGFKKPGLSPADIRTALLGSADARATVTDPIPAQANAYLYQDGQLRFGAKYDLQLTQLTRHDLKDLVRGLLEQLYQESARATAGN